MKNGNTKRGILFETNIEATRLVPGSRLFVRFFYGLASAGYDIFMWH